MAASGVKVRLRGAKEAKAGLTKTSGAIRSGTRRGIQDTTIKVQGIVKRVFGTRQSVPGVGEGGLRRAIIQFLENMENGVRGVIGVHASVPYGRIQEHGGQTPAQVIVPRIKKALAFPVGFGAFAAQAARGRGLTPKQSQKSARAARGADFVVVKSVQHPGSKIPARPFLAPSLEKDRPNIPDRVRKRIAEAIERAG